MVKVSENGIAMLGNKAQGYTFTSASSLNNDNIIKSYNNPKHATKTHSKGTNSGE